jgi:hypothetical protein
MGRFAATAHPSSGNFRLGLETKTGSQKVKPETAYPCPISCSGVNKNRGDGMRLPSYSQYISLHPVRLRQENLFAAEENSAARNRRREAQFRKVKLVA